MKIKLLTATIILGILLGPLNGLCSFAAAITFKDIKGHWAQADIQKAVEAGYIKGYNDNTFKPNMEVKRAEFISMLNRAFAVPEDGTGCSFKDVQSSDWFARDIWSAVKEGYLNIYTSDMLDPNQALSRQEAAALTANLTKIGKAKEGKSFKDADSIAGWAQEQVIALASVGIMNGDTNGYFKPAAGITRAEAVALINRAWTYVTGTKIQAALTVTGSTVNIRSGPDTVYNVLAKVQKGEKLTTDLHSKNDWYRITINGMAGWITGSYVTVKNSNNTSDGRSITDRGGDVDRGNAAGNESGNLTGSGTGSTTAGGINSEAGSGTGSATAGGINSEAGSGTGSTTAGGINDATGGGTGSTTAGGINDATGSGTGSETGSAILNGGMPGDGTNVSNGSSPAESQSGMESELVVIDAGHGGKDDGASGLNGTKEKNVTLEIALKLSKLLEDAGYSVLLTRSDDTYVSLDERSAIADNAKASIFVSIHCNSSTSHNGYGTETYTETTKVTPVYAHQEDSRRLAGFVQNELVKALALNDRGTKEQDLSVCRKTNAPSILVETAFIDNNEEEKLLNDASFQTKVAGAIKLGIDSYFLNK